MLFVTGAGALNRIKDRKSPDQIEKNCDNIILNMIPNII